MPIYEYKCTECGQQFDKLVRTGDEEVKCPSCNCAEVERQLSTPGRTNWSESVRDFGCAPRRYT